MQRTQRAAADKARASFSDMSDEEDSADRENADPTQRTPTKLKGQGRQARQAKDEGSSGKGRSSKKKAPDAFDAIERAQQQQQQEQDQQQEQQQQQGQQQHEQQQVNVGPVQLSQGSEDLLAQLWERSGRDLGSTLQKVLDYSALQTGEQAGSSGLASSGRRIDFDLMSDVPATLPCTHKEPIWSLHLTKPNSAPTASAQLNEQVRATPGQARDLFDINAGCAYDEYALNPNVPVGVAKDDVPPPGGWSKLPLPRLGADPFARRAVVCEYLIWDRPGAPPHPLSTVGFTKPGAKQLTVYGFPWGRTDVPVTSRAADAAPRILVDKRTGKKIMPDDGGGDGDGGSSDGEHDSSSNDSDNSSSGSDSDDSSNSDSDDGHGAAGPGGSQGQGEGSPRLVRVNTGADLTELRKSFVVKRVFLEYSTAYYYPRLLPGYRNPKAVKDVPYDVPGSTPGNNKWRPEGAFGETRFTNRWRFLHICETLPVVAEAFRHPIDVKVQLCWDYTMEYSHEGAYVVKSQSAGQSGGTTAGKAGIKAVIAAQGAAGHTTGLLDSRFEATWYASANQPTFIALARDRAQKGGLNPGFKSSAQIPKYVLEELGLDVEGSCKGLVGRGSKTEERAGYLHVGWESVGNQLPAGTGIGEGVDLGKGLLTRFEEVRARLSVEEGAVFQGKGGGQVSSVRLHIVGDGSPARLVMYS